jgi:ferredoxin
MLANYGYGDAAGEFYITIDTGSCTGCGDCVAACPAAVLEVGEDENDPLNDEPVAFVAVSQRRKLRYACARCKPDNEQPALPCVAACAPAAIAHSW